MNRFQLTKRRSEMKKANLNTALEAMNRKNAALIHANIRGRHWFVEGVGEVTSETAAAICARPDVVGAKDSLWPGLDQTWRMLR
jgi:hypothetical protein